MRVFVTGAAGFIGSAVVRDLLANGHNVLGLARNDANEKKLKELGAEVHRGDLNDTASLAAGAKSCDGVAHLGFVHDFTNYAASLVTDRAAIEAMLGAIAGTNKPFVGTSGVLLTSTPGRAATEEDAPADNPHAARGIAEKIVTGAKGVRGSVIRLAPTVHDAGDKGFIPMIIDMARKAGFAAYVGDGQNRWPAVHRKDAATLYRLALDKAQAGTSIHGIAEEGIAFRAIAEAIGQGLSLPVRSLTGEEAQKHFTWMLGFASIDAPTSNALTRQRLGWQPTGPTLLADLREAGYFK